MSVAYPKAVFCSDCKYRRGSLFPLCSLQRNTYNHPKHGLKWCVHCNEQGQCSLYEPSRWKRLKEWLQDEIDIFFTKVAMREPGKSIDADTLAKELGLDT